jgi:hypothetical protein
LFKPSSSNQKLLLQRVLCNDKMSYKNVALIIV